MSGTPKVRVGRVYEDPIPLGGTRVLVDRLWPRGISKDKAALDEWCKQIAPSAELRQWYGHRPERFNEFSRRYRAELGQPERAEALQHLQRLAMDKTMTLLTATRRSDISSAAVLAEILNQQTGCGDPRDAG
jgi:uncharacterized protein YeaO (DUF488 family)